MMRSLLSALLFSLMFALADRAGAVTLEIDAPKPLRDLLQQHLELARALHDGVELSDQEIGRLSADAPVQGRELLQTEGYFDAVIKPERAGDTIRLKVDPGPRADVSEVILHFSGEIEGKALAERVRAAWTLRAGEPFTQSDWSAAKVGALTLARAQGYAQAHWASTVARVETGTHQVFLSLVMDSGPLYHLGELRIEGLKYLSPESVRRLAVFEPGEPYTEQTLTDFENRLRKTLLFDGVAVQLQPDDNNAAAAPVLVTVREAARQQATTGIGYHANTGQSVSLEYLNRQPFGLPLRARTKLLYGRDQRLAEVELSSHPQLDLSRNLGSVQYEQDRSGEEIQTNLTTRIGRIRETERDERLTYLELLRARDDTAAGRSTAAALSANIQWTRRRLDSLILPTEGHQALLLLGAGRSDSSDASAGPFGRMQFKLAAYRPLGGHWFGNTRMEVDQVFARANVGIPEKLLFRAGGDDSVRGYGYQDLGPMVNGATVGGRVSLTGSVEAAHPLRADWPSLWGAVFVDAGNAADRWQDYRPVWGYGVGLRWRSPVGPLKVDIARGVETGRFHLSFSVGVTF
ncbi:MAG TPA: BamA/TamA family outer membrane protein [Burkholderiaceae bacterium]|jgi:translocation and assembly module TamA